MISTVTTSTVSTVTTVAIAGSLALISVITLVVLLIQKEVTTAAKDQLGRALGQTALGRALNIGIIPLLLAFALIVAVKIAEVLK